MPYLSVLCRRFASWLGPLCLGWAVAFVAAWCAPPLLMQEAFGSLYFLLWPSLNLGGFVLLLSLEWQMAKGRPMWKALLSLLACGFFLIGIFVGVPQTVAPLRHRIECAAMRPRFARYERLFATLRTEGYGGDQQQRRGILRGRERFLLAEGAPLRVAILTPDSGSEILVYDPTGSVSHISRTDYSNSELFINVMLEDAEHLDGPWYRCRFY